jgi:hypothetical protein
MKAAATAKAGRAGPFITFKSTRSASYLDDPEADFRAYAKRARSDQHLVVGVQRPGHLVLFELDPVVFDVIARVEGRTKAEAEEALTAIRRERRGAAP